MLRLFRLKVNQPKHDKQTVRTVGTACNTLCCPSCHAKRILATLGTGYPRFGPLAVLHMPGSHVVWYGGSVPVKEQILQL